MEPSVVVRPDAERVRVIRCVGDFDQDTLAPLTTAAQEAAEAPELRRIVLDVSAVTFADTSMLNLMLRLLRTERLVLAGPLPAPLRRLLELTQVLELFPVADSVTAARAL
ncbi:STAS domain-containing protein [Streptomyces subrutilus]|uniref:STAS domain-containing protein n=1 Tax=Streptomyces subrutilus TaxID=36818 RepID=UPI0033CE6428